MYEFRKMTIEDLDFFLEIRNECRNNLHDNSFFTLSQSKKWFSEFNPSFFIVLYNKKRIGYFRTSNWELDNKTVSIGADIHKTFRGQGHATPAYNLFMNFLVLKYEIKTFFLEVLSNNTVAIKLYKKLNFVKFSKRFHRKNINKEDIYSISMFKIIENK